MNETDEMIMKETAENFSSLCEECDKNPAFPNENPHHYLLGWEDAVFDMLEIPLTDEERESLISEFLQYLRPTAYDEFLEILDFAFINKSLNKQQASVFLDDAAISGIPKQDGGFLVKDIIACRKRKE